MKKQNSDYPVYLFNEGTNYETYRMLRLCYMSHAGKKMWRFRCWAPRAVSVSVVGDFNEWNRQQSLMKPIGGGIWECYIGNLKRFDNYKFSIETEDGRILEKTDPFALHCETPPGTASKIYDIIGYRWNDDKYLQHIATRDIYAAPMNIYEVHLGSWRRHVDGNCFGYRNLAEHLIPYVIEMGYTHIELMPITEHPYEGSWGYQISGLFAPTARYGTPHDFMYFVDRCHQNGIGVLMDFVISHFPKDAAGLYEFDGKPLFEYEDEKKREHKTWGTRVFDYSRPEVQSFLVSAVCFWFEHYHIDGMRLDAVASMLYLDYDRKDGEWTPNIHGGNHNLEAIAFLQKLNSAVLSRFPNAIMIAEESTAFPMVTLPPDVGGLGFNFKWNMGWMNDILTYIRIDPFFRKGAHDKLTFPLTYAYSENYILPFSHDEVVHGKASMISKMPGDYQSKFAALKALYAFQYAHPGKKLNFMGNEFGQFIEWDYNKALDWHLLEYDNHKKLKLYVKDLNNIYLMYSELFERDNSYAGFKWIIVDDSVQNIIAFARYNIAGEKLIVIVNFSDVLRRGYEVGVPDAGEYEIVINSNADKYGGNGPASAIIKSVPRVNHGYEQSLILNLAGDSALYLKKRNPSVLDVVADKH
ncbi:MAG: 1,4-alpha-glucan branching protein GlgB [Christensenellaceae bacterium]|jgi:1,4-alpha-glucan branching enzyme|nr:1,4-alpha-glucan branching protein GlgB [Christensenellaceae bacterium]